MFSNKNHFDIIVDEVKMKNVIMKFVKKKYVKKKNAKIERGAV